MELNGVLAPLPTPLTDDGSSVSEIRLLRLLRHIEGYGVSGYVVCGEVGEFSSIGYSERKQMAEILLRNTASVPQVIVNVSTLSTTSTLDLAQHAARHGAKACVLMPPFFGAFTDRELFQFFRTVGQYAGLPVILVDPKNRLGTELKAELDAVTGLFQANPTMWSAGADGAICRASVDDFAFDLGSSTTLALFRPVHRLLEKPEEEIRKLSKFVAGNGKARIVKTAFAMQGLELGPLRGPLQEPPAEIQDQLRAYLASEE